MYCSNCGKENDDGVAFCSHCGKSPNEATVADTNTNIATNSGTVGLIRACYPWVFAAMFWLTVIGGMIGGAKVAQGLYALIDPYGDGDWGAMIVGGLIGLVGGFLFAVWTGGVVATLLKMDENLQYLADKEKAKAQK